MLFLPFYLLKALLPFLSQHIVLSHGAFRLIAQRIGHDETVGILYLIVRCLAARWTSDFYHVVSQYLEDTARFVVTILALQIVG